MNSFLVLVLIALSASARPWIARYSVTFERDGDKAVAHVSAQFEWKGGGQRPERLELAFHSDGCSPTFGSMVESASAATTRSGTFQVDAVQWSDDRDHLSIPVLNDQSAAIRYTVKLEHDRGEGNRSYDETPRRLSRFMFWTGRSLFALPSGASGEVAFKAPEGESVSSSLPTNGNGLSSFTEEDEVHESFLTVGSKADLVAIGPNQMQVVIDAALDEQRVLILDQIRRFLSAARAALGAPPPDRSVIVVQKGPEGLLDGSMIGHDASAVVPGVAEGDANWRTLLCHELFHFYNGYLLRLDARNMWFSEGFTEYYTHRLLAETGDVAGERLLHVVREWITDYLAEAGKVGLQQAGDLGAKNNTMIYKGGALAALTLDVRLRRASRNQKSLDNVMADLLAKCLPDRHRVERATFEQLVHKIGGQTTKPFFEQHIEGVTPLPLADDLAKIGLALTHDEIEVPEIQDVAVTLIRCPGMVIESDGIRIQRTDAPSLEAEDLLVEVDGRAVRDYDQLCIALHRYGPGDRISVVVHRKGERRTVSLELGGQKGSNITRTKRHVTDLEVKVPGEKTAKAILQAIFHFDQR